MKKLKNFILKYEGSLQIGVFIAALLIPFWVVALILNYLIPQPENLATNCGLELLVVVLLLIILSLVIILAYKAWKYSHRLLCKTLEWARGK